MAIELKLDTSDLALRERFLVKSDAITARLTEEMDVLMLRLESAIVSEKLHGQVLRQRTGKLAGSIRSQGATQEGAELVGEVVGGGGPAWYGKLHEYGFGPYDYEVTRHVHMYYGDLTFKKLIHSRGFPERSFMRSTLSEFEATIVESMQAALDEAVSV